MQVSFTSEAALEAVCLFLSFASAIRTDQHPPAPPSDPRIPHLQLQNEHRPCPSAQSNLTITIENQQDNPLFFYVTGKDPIHQDNFVILRSQDDCYTWFTKPQYNNTASTMPYYFVDGSAESSDFHTEIQANNNISFTLPSYSNSARLYVAQDKLRFGTNVGGSGDGFVEPSSTNKALPEYNITWQFIEFTYGEGNFVLNPSYVDFAAMPLDLIVKSRTAGASMQNITGLRAGALGNICSDLRGQTQKDNQSWADMCLTDDRGAELRAISANQYLSLHPNDKMSTYYDDYVDRVWEKYRDQNLTINTQDNGSGGKVQQGREFTCKVNAGDGKLWCGLADVPGEAYSFRKPTTAEIMGCVQGSQDPSTQDLSPFTVTGWEQSLIVPRLCAAFTRSTLLLPDGNVQPNGNITAERYYTDPITNHYARIIHENLEGHIGYAFAYDDTNPMSNENATSNAGGVIQDADPELLSITVR